MIEKVPAQGGSAYGGKNKIFAYSILGLNVVAAWISWWVLAGTIFGQSKHAWLFPSFAFGFWGIAFTLMVILVMSRQHIFASLAAGAAGYFLFFGFGFSAIGLLGMLALFVFTERATKKEIRRGVSIDFYHLVSHTLRYFVTAVCIVIAVSYYFSITERPQSSALVIEEKTLEMEINWGLKAAGMILPEEKKVLIDDINSNVSVDEFLSKNFIEPEFQETLNENQSASEAAKMIGNTVAIEVKNQMLSKSKRDLSKQLEVDVVGEQPMKRVLMAYIDKTERSFFDYTGTDKFYIPIILASGIFLTARILGTVVDLILGLVILAVLKLLRKTGFVEIGSEQREVAMIEYSI
jgi:hypothetical protein